MSGRRPNGSGTKPRKQPDGRWRQDITVPDPITGKGKRMAVYGKSRDELTGKVEAIRDRIRAGRPAKDSSDSVGTWINHWIRTTLAARPVKESTKLNYEGLLRTHVLNASIAHVPVGQVRPSTIEGWLNELRARATRSTETTHRTTFIAFKLALDTAVRDGLIATNPLKLVDPPRRDTAVKATPTLDEVRAFLDHTRDSDDWAMWLTIAILGARCGEVVAWQWPDLDLAAGTLKVQRTATHVRHGLATGDPKSKSSRRTFHLPVGLVAVLQLHRKRQIERRLKSGGRWHDEGWIFPSEVGTMQDPRNVRRRLNNARKAMGTDVAQPATIHALRHFATTHLIGVGTDPKTASGILGHSDTAITMDIYTHTTEGQMRDALERHAAGLLDGTQDVG